MTLYEILGSENVLYKVWRSRPSVCRSVCVPVSGTKPLYVFKKFRKGFSYNKTGSVCINVTLRGVRVTIVSVVKQ
jgi:hypothetical protein